MNLDSTPLTLDFTMNPPCRSMAGIRRLEVVDLRAVERILYTRTGAIVQLGEGAMWMTVESHTAAAVTQAVEGHAYQHEITATWYSRSQNPVTMLDEMREARYLLCKTDSNGDRWLYGSVEDPMRFSWHETDDGTADGTSAYSLEFHCTTRLPAMRLIQWDIEDSLLATEDSVLVEHQAREQFFSITNYELSPRSS